MFNQKIAKKLHKSSKIAAALCLLPLSSHSSGFGDYKSTKSTTSSTTNSLSSSKLFSVIESDSDKKFFHLNRYNFNARIGAGAFFSQHSIHDSIAISNTTFQSASAYYQNNDSSDFSIEQMNEFIFQNSKGSEESQLNSIRRYLLSQSAIALGYDDIDDILGSDLNSIIEENKFQQDFEYVDKFLKDAIIAYNTNNDLAYNFVTPDNKIYLSDPSVTEFILIILSQADNFYDAAGRFDASKLPLAENGYSLSELYSKANYSQVSDKDQLEYNPDTDTVYQNNEKNVKIQALYDYELEKLEVKYNNKNTYEASDFASIKLTRVQFKSNEDSENKDIGIIDNLYGQEHDVIYYFDASINDYLVFDPSVSLIYLENFKDISSNSLHYLAPIDESDPDNKYYYSLKQDGSAILVHKNDTDPDNIIYQQLINLQTLSEHSNSSLNDFTGLSAQKDALIESISEAQDNGININSDGVVEVSEFFEYKDLSDFSKTFTPNYVDNKSEISQQVLNDFLEFYGNPENSMPGLYDSLSSTNFDLTFSDYVANLLVSIGLSAYYGPESMIYSGLRLGTTILSNQLSDSDFVHAVTFDIWGMFGASVPLSKLTKGLINIYGILGYSGLFKSDVTMQLAQDRNLESYISGVETGFGINYIPSLKMFISLFFDFTVPVFLGDLYTSQDLTYNGYNAADSPIGRHMFMPKFSTGIQIGF